MSARERMRETIALQGVAGAPLDELRTGVKFLCSEVDRLERLVERLNEHVARLTGDGK